MVPNRRSSAEAIQLMLSHALGEAGSPYLIGLMAGSLKENMIGDLSQNPGTVQSRKIHNKLVRILMNTFVLVGNGTVVMSEMERDYYAFQYSLFMCVAFEVIGGLFFLWATFYVVDDKRKAAEYIQGWDLIRHLCWAF